VPKYLTAGALVLALWVTGRSGEVWTGVLPAALVAALALVSYVHWERHDRPWHDWTVILLLVPAILASVWIGVGGLIIDVARSNDGRLLYEVGPAVGLVGLLCTLISYHGRHHPDDS
jgi:peptidoglycan/LPS O-acetylase OafA/YrhL